LPESPQLFIGLISGTSVDGIDAAVVEIGESACRLVAQHFEPYPDELRQQLQRAAQQPADTDLWALGSLHTLTGEAFAAAAMRLINNAGIERSHIRAIGSHGQTLLHGPDIDAPFTLQVGDPAIIAERTGMLTVADFRAGDMAAGGQGAPLAPAFHAWAFGASNERAVLNLGGIANITRLRPGAPVIGFDTGPASTLLDYWSLQQRGKPFDENGDWAAGGNVRQDLLDLLLEDEWLRRPPPKSTGVDYFSPGWLQKHLATFSSPDARDVQATLAEFSAATIADALAAYTEAQEIGVCGGGAHNGDLLRRIAARLPGRKLVNTESWGIAADWVEAAAFAWLAQRRLAGLPSNEPAVTGASHAVSLGAVYLPTAC
jgi:anhydro-N-acetylmuramic acid kinase